MTKTQTTRPAGRIPALSAKDEAAISALIDTFTEDDYSNDYDRVDAEVRALRYAAGARACRRIIAKLTWMILDDQDEAGAYPAKIAELTTLAEWLEAQA